MGDFDRTGGVWAALASGLICAALLAQPAAARSVEGSFAGVAQGSRIDALSAHPGNFDGQPVTGTFSLDMSKMTAAEFVPVPDYVMPNEAAYRISGEALTVTLFAAGQVVSFGTLATGVGGWIFLNDDGVHQGLSIEAGDVGYYHFATLDIGAASGALFHDLDLHTFGPGPVDVSSSGVQFFASRGFGAGVLLDSINLIPSPVPEPATWLSMLMGLGWLALSRWQRFRAARSPGRLSAFVSP